MSSYFSWSYVKLLLHVYNLAHSLEIVLEIGPISKVGKSFRVVVICNLITQSLLVVTFYTNKIETSQSNV